VGRPGGIIAPEIGLKLLGNRKPSYGVQNGILKEGDIVKVVNLRGCPKANTMNHCHIATESGQFAGLVCCNSLTK
jgi:hypothetical protein